MLREKFIHATFLTAGIIILIIALSSALLGIAPGGGRPLSINDPDDVKSYFSETLYRKRIFCIVTLGLTAVGLLVALYGAAEANVALK